MNFFVGYLVGIWYAMRRMKMWLLVYGIALLFAATATLAMPDIFRAGLGHSIAAKELLQGFNHTVFDDFFHQHGAQLRVVLGRLPTTGLLFLFLFIWLSGGILKTYDMIAEKFTFQRFWAGCLQYFWLLIKVFVIFLIIHLIVASIVYFPVLRSIWSGFDGLENELSFYRMLKFSFVIHLILAVLIAMISDYTKVRLVKEGRDSVFKELIPSCKFVFRNGHRTIPMYLMYLITFFLLSAGYWWLSERIGMQTFSAILIVLFLQQLYVFIRVGMKLMNLGSICAMHEAILLRDRKKDQPMEIEL